ncbi:MAG: hypothetical protein K1X74_07645 [Pirellulales bacterium]|nr:hypothetical protein [Pirellulales bacterium]
MHERPPQTEPRDDERPIRWELVARLRREIAEGNYDTPERCAAAIDRLLERWHADER